MNTPTKMKGGIIFLIIILIICGCLGVAAFIITLNKTRGEQECKKLENTGKCSPCNLLKSEDGRKLLKECGENPENTSVCGKLIGPSRIPESIYNILQQAEKNDQKALKCKQDLEDFYKS